KSAAQAKKASTVEPEAAPAKPRASRAKPKAASVDPEATSPKTKARTAASTSKAAGASAPSSKATAKPKAARAAKPGTTPKSAPAKKAVATTATTSASVSERPWLKSYPPGIPAEIEPFKHDSLGDFMLDCCRQHADRAAFISMGKTLTFAELEEKSRHLAAFLLSLGLQKGARRSEERRVGKAGRARG